MKKYFFILIAVIVAFTACNHKSNNAEQAVSISEVRLQPPVVKPDEESKEKSMAFETPIVVDEPLGNADVNQVARAKPINVAKKIIKEGEMRFETNDVAQIRKQIISSLKQLGGYAEDDSETTDGGIGSKEYTLLIRLPAKSFDAFLGTVSSTATKIDSRNIRIKDVTTQFIDTKTRLDNKLQLEKRYLNLLNRAGKMRDLLDIEEKLTEIRSDIEATQGQLNYMSKQVEYSSLTITFYTKQPEQVAAGNGFGYKLKSALISGWESLQSLFFGLLSGWYLLLIIAVLIIWIRKWRGKRRVANQA